MSTPKDPSIPRRELLRGAIGVVGASAIALAPGSALGQALKSQPVRGGRNLVSLGYWEGTTLVAADQLPSGDRTLGVLEVTIRGYGDQLGLQSIDVLMPTEGQPTPFHVWTAPPSGNASATFTVPVDESGAFTLSPNVGGTSVATRLTTAKDTSMKLREGTYVLAPGNIDWNSYDFSINQTSGPLVAHPGVILPQYVVIQVARA